MKSKQPLEETRERRPSRPGVKFTGVKSVLLADVTGSPPVSSPDFIQWQGIDTQKSRVQQKRIYQSDERSRALQLCQWGMQGDSYTLHNSITMLVLFFHSAINKS